jgi:NTP pyrophosphatase (non-canonical NTP hydrolase)
MDGYQYETERTGRAYDGDPQQLLILALGLTGEAGEVADIVKKWAGHGVPIPTEEMLKELGDVLWYVSEIARYFGWPLSAVATQNVLKLRARYPDGFVEGGGNR